MIKIMQTLTNILKLYTRPHLLCILLLGIASGIPFILVSFTLTIWLVQAGYSNTTIGWMFLTTLPYSLKFLLAPLLDRYSIPFLCQKFGQRRGWMLFAQIFLSIAIFGLSLTDPIKNIYLTLGCAFFLSFCATTQDIVLDAYRIERLTPNELGVGTALGGIGFRIGMLISSAGTLWLSSRYTWSTVFGLMAFLSLIGPFAVYLAKEPFKSNETEDYQSTFPSFSSHLASIKESFVTFMQRPQWRLILCFIFFYKVSDAMPTAMSGPLLIDLQFTTDEIAFAAKIFGMLMMIIGGFIGGIVVSQWGPTRGAMLCGTAQLLSPLVLIFLVMAGHDMSVLMLTIAIQQLCCGMGHTAFVTYLSSLCTKKLTATQFALFYSISSASRILLSTSAGFISDHIAWSTFFLIVTLCGLPFLYIIRKLEDNPYGFIRQANA